MTETLTGTTKWHANIAGLRHVCTDDMPVHSGTGYPSAQQLEALHAYAAGNALNVSIWYDADDLRPHPQSGDVVPVSTVPLGREFEFICRAQPSDSVAPIHTTVAVAFGNVTLKGTLPDDMKVRIL